MPEPVPPTIQELEAKISALEKRIAAGGGELEARVMKSLQDQVAALEAKLAKAKEGETPAAAPAAPPRKRFLDNLDALKDLF